MVKDLKTEASVKLIVDLIQEELRGRLELDSLLQSVSLDSEGGSLVVQKKNGESESISLPRGEVTSKQLSDAVTRLEGRIDSIEVADPEPPAPEIVAPTTTGSVQDVTGLVGTQTWRRHVRSLFDDGGGTLAISVSGGDAQYDDATGDVTGTYGADATITVTASNGVGNPATLGWQVTVTEQPPADTTLPVLSGGSIQVIEGTIVQAQVDVADTSQTVVTLVLVEKGAPRPTDAQLEQGLNSSGDPAIASVNGVVTANGGTISRQMSLNGTGLVDCYAVAVDTSSNRQSAFIDSTTKNLSAHSFTGYSDGTLLSETSPQYGGGVIGVQGDGEDSPRHEVRDGQFRVGAYNGNSVYWHIADQTDIGRLQFEYTPSLDSNGNFPSYRFYAGATNEKGADPKIIADVQQDKVVFQLFDPSNDATPIQAGGEMALESPLVAGETYAIKLEITRDEARFSINGQTHVRSHTQLVNGYWGYKAPGITYDVLFGSEIRLDGPLRAELADASTRPNGGDLRFDPIPGVDITADPTQSGKTTDPDSYLQGLGDASVEYSIDGNPENTPPVYIDGLGSLRVSRNNPLPLDLYTIRATTSDGREATTGVYVQVRAADGGGGTTEPDMAPEVEGFYVAPRFMEPQVNRYVTNEIFETADGFRVEGDGGAQVDWEVKDLVPGDKYTASIDIRAIENPADIVNFEAIYGGDRIASEGIINGVTAGGDTKTITTRFTAPDGGVARLSIITRANPGGVEIYEVSGFRFAKVDGVLYQRDTSQILQAPALAAGEMWAYPRSRTSWTVHYEPTDPTAVLQVYRTGLPEAPSEIQYREYRNADGRDTYYHHIKWAEKVGRFPMLLEMANGSVAHNAKDNRIGAYPGDVSYLHYREVDAQGNGGEFKTIGPFWNYDDGMSSDANQDMVWITNADETGYDLDVEHDDGTVETFEVLNDRSNPVVVLREASAYSSGPQLICEEPIVAFVDDLSRMDAGTSESPIYNQRYLYNVEVEILKDGAIVVTNPEFPLDTSSLGSGVYQVVYRMKFRNMADIVLTSSNVSI